jgi:hypothetical protein
MRKSIILLAMFFSVTAMAQNSPATTGSKVNFISSLGLSIPDNKFKPGITNSIQTSTGLEYMVSAHSSFTGVIDFDTYGFDRSGATYSLSSQMKATSFVFSYRHKLTTGSLQPYLKAGGGLARFSIPTVNIGQGYTNIENKVEVNGVVTGEAGLQYRVLGRYALIVAGERQWVGKSDLLNDSFRGTTVKLGLISSF